ncbi:uncharacterized protein LOC112518700 [Cynara cardunculus var. scolymus]|nr:uncharacterized protein LOC112518700 [Cynara cardunculus var. scolymus]
MDNSSPLAINNLFGSITRLGDGEYLKSEDVKTMLLSPKVAPNYQRVTELLPIYDPRVCSGHFLKKHATFIVSDDLKVTVSPSTSIISVLNTIGIPDVEVVEVSIGKQEALAILKASLTSTSVLTDCLIAFTRKQKAEPSS